MPRKRFADQVVWITGASSGIGRAMALEFAREGAHVALSARRTERLHELARDIETLGRQALVVPCDVADEQQLEQAVAATIAAFGRLDVAVANAGFGIGGSIERLTADEWRRQLDVNVVGAVMTARYALPHLRQTRGRVALMGSIAAFIPTPYAGAYAASKAALQSIGETLSAELYGSGVSCTTLNPGYVESDITRVDRTGRLRPDWVETRPRALLWSAEKAARVMVRAIHRRRRVYIFTGHGRVVAFVGRHLPGLAALLAGRMAGARRRRRARAGRPL